jgi:hypothetical protein
LSSGGKAQTREGFLNLARILMVGNFFCRTG